MYIYICIVIMLFFARIQEIMWFRPAALGADTSSAKAQVAFVQMSCLHVTRVDLGAL